MKKLKIFNAVEEIMQMDELQLIQAKNHFKWAHLKSALEELKEYIHDQEVHVLDVGDYYDEEKNE